MVSGIIGSMGKVIFPILFGQNYSKAAKGGKMAGTIKGNSSISKEALAEIEARMQKDCTCGEGTICRTCIIINHEAERQGLAVLVAGKENIFYGNLKRL